MNYWYDNLEDTIDEDTISPENLINLLCDQSLTSPFEKMPTTCLFKTNIHIVISNLNQLNIKSIHQLKNIILKHKPNISPKSWNALGLFNQALKLECNLECNFGYIWTDHLSLKQ